MGRKKIGDEPKKAHKAEYMREYWKSHRAEQNAARKKWKEAHPEEARRINTEGHRKWREANREKYNAYMREYRRRRKAGAKAEPNKEEDKC